MLVNPFCYAATYIPSTVVVEGTRYCSRRYGLGAGLSARRYPGRAGARYRLIARRAAR